MSGIDRVGKDMLKLPNNWRVLAALGTGGFGVVAAVEKVNGERKAVKKIISAGSSHRRALLALRELRLQKHCSAHPNILALEEVLPLSDDGLHDVYMVLPVGETSLEKLVPVSPSRRDELMKDLISGLAHMHAVNVVHRDLKPSNCIVAGGVLKICDFGGARVLGQDGTWSPQKSPRITTHSYAAPEVLLTELGQRTMVGSAVDVWAAGCVYYEMGTATVLFGGAGKDRRAVLQLIMRLVGAFPQQLPGCVTAREQHWTQRLLTYQPTLRPSAETVLQEMFGARTIFPGVATPDLPGDESMDWAEFKQRVQHECDISPRPFLSLPTRVLQASEIPSVPELQTPEYWPAYIVEVETMNTKGRSTPTVPELSTPEVWPSTSTFRR
jgi:serine/threonine protein kinase